MVLRKEKPIVLKGSASALANNLSVQVDLQKNFINYAVVHKAVVNLVSASTDGTLVNHRTIQCKDPSSASAGGTIVLQAKIVALANRLILVVTSQKGIQMFDAEASIMIYWHAIGDGNPEKCSFARGICGVGDATLCVGNHEGNILVFDIPSRGTNISQSQTLRGHRGAICTLECHRDHMVSSDDLSSILVWNTNGEEFQMMHKISGDGTPCSSLSLWTDFAVAGYGSGLLQVINIYKGTVVCEAAAHAKWITSVDVSERNGVVLSAGEDSFIRIWNLGKSGELEHRHSEHVTDLQLQGAKFIGRDGKAFGCTGYDSNEIMFYTQA